MPMCGVTPLGASAIVTGHLARVPGRISADEGGGTFQADRHHRSPAQHRHIDECQGMATSRNPNRCYYAIPWIISLHHVIGAIDDTYVGTGANHTRRSMHFIQHCQRSSWSIP